MIAFGRRVIPVLLAVLCTAGLLAACKGTTTKGAPKTVVVTVPPTTSTAPKTSTPPKSNASTTPTSTKTLQAGKTVTTLPGRCGTLLPTPAVVNALGRNITGKSVFVVGVADASIGRLTYINCRYGGSKAKPAVEIQVSLYRTAAKASARIDPTVKDYTNNGAKASDTRLEHVPATILLGGRGAGYAPAIVMALGQRTVAVSIQNGFVTAKKLPLALAKLATLAAERTTKS